MNESSEETPVEVPVTVTKTNDNDDSDPLINPERNDPLIDQPDKNPLNTARKEATRIGINIPPPKEAKRFMEDDYDVVFHDNINDYDHPFPVICQGCSKEDYECSDRFAITACTILSMMGLACDIAGYLPKEIENAPLMSAASIATTFACIYFAKRAVRDIEIISSFVVGTAIPSAIDALFHDDIVKQGGNVEAFAAPMGAAALITGAGLFAANVIRKSIDKCKKEKVTFIKINESDDDSSPRNA